MPGALYQRTSWTGQPITSHLVMQGVASIAYRAVWDLFRKITFTLMHQMGMQVI